MLRLHRAGLQTTIQGYPRRGYRHMGVPWSGPADPLSMALANRLVGKSPHENALELTLTGAEFEFGAGLSFAVTGGAAEVLLNGCAVNLHETHRARSGDVLTIGPCQTGCRSYLAVSGEVQADTFLGSTSTYLPARLGGHQARALTDGDTLAVLNAWDAPKAKTPEHLRPYFNDRVLLQVVAGPDFSMLGDPEHLFSTSYSATRRQSRMGVQLAPDKQIAAPLSENRPSSAVFPGAIQCPPDGMPFLLLPDCQTTGGYPHILQVIRSDRFLLGQIRPGSRVRFVKRDPDYALNAIRLRWKIYSDWLTEPSI